MKEYLLALIPIFVAMDAIGILPIFLSLTEGMTPLNPLLAAIAVMMIRMGIQEMVRGWSP